MTVCIHWGENARGGVTGRIQTDALLCQWPFSIMADTGAEFSDSSHSLGGSHWVVCSKLFCISSLQLSSVTVAILKNYLKSVGLRTTGKKQELIESITEHLGL